MRTVLGAALTLVCAGSALAQPTQTFTIAVPNGTFELRDIRVSKGRGAVTLKGQLLNNTASDWTAVSFRVLLYDRQGQRLSLGSQEGASSFPVFGVKRGSSTQLDSRLYGDVKGDIGKFEIVFDSGQYPAIYSFSLTKPSVSRTLEHEDAVLKVSFALPGNRHLAFNLRNKTEQPIKLDWNQVSYVDPDGKSHKVVHEGVRFIERDRAQPSATIPPGAFLEDFVYPSDAVTMVGGQWMTPMLFPEAPKAALLKGKAFSLFMPLEINGVLSNYNFVFAIDDIAL